MHAPAIHMQTEFLVREIDFFFFKQGHFLKLFLVDHVGDANLFQN